MKSCGRQFQMKGVDALEIKILGTGCPKCYEVEKRVRNVLAETGVPADIEKVTDLKKIMAYGILAPPGLVINGTLKSSGRIPRAEDIRKWVKESAA